MNDDMDVGIISLKYKGYDAIVKWSDEDNLYVGEITGIRDIVAFHAEEKKNIEEKFHMAVDNYLDMKADEALLQEAEKRVQELDPSKDISAEKLYKEYGITEKDLEGWEDIEIDGEDGK